MAPTPRHVFHLLPNAHLDPVWLWDWREGLNEGITTTRTILDLMDAFPELTFMRGEAAIYQHIERTDPATFARLKKQIAAGRWEVVGGTMIQPGELQGCIGCHEDRIKQAPVNNNPIALLKPAHKLDGWHGASRFFSYMRDVQPVFDRHCVKCHDFGKPAGQKLLLCGDRSMTFAASYKALFLKHAINCLGTGKAPILQPYTWGSTRSPIIERLDKGHQGIKLAPDEMDALVTWIDLNGPYYPTYDCAYPNNLAGRCPLDNNQVARLGKLVGLEFRRFIGYGANRGALVSFDRPELSPCLSGLPKNSTEYKEALAIIQAGQVQLKAHPEADREGFVPAANALNREKFYEERRQIELKNRQAILKGEKVYDEQRKQNP